MWHGVALYEIRSGCQWNSLRTSTGTASGAAQDWPSLLSLLALVHFVKDKSGVPRRPIVVSMTQALFIFCMSLFRFSQELSELFFSKVHGLATRRQSHLI